MLLLVLRIERLPTWFSFPSPAFRGLTVGEGQPARTPSLVMATRARHSPRMRESVSRCPLVQIEMTILLEAQALIDRVSHRR